MKEVLTHSKGNIFVKIKIICCFATLILVGLGQQILSDDANFAKSSFKVMNCPSDSLGYSGLPPLIFVLSVAITGGPSRFDSFLWTLYSYAALKVPWRAVYLFIDIKEYPGRQVEVEGAIRAVFSEKSTLISLLWYRIEDKSEWYPFIEEIAGNKSQIGGPDSLVWFMQNDDHPFVDFGTDVLIEGLHLLAKEKTVFKSLYLSHWPEIVRQSVKENRQERIGRSYVRFPTANTDSIQIFGANLLFHLLVEIPWWENSKGIKSRIDLLYSKLKPLSIMIYVPLREQCRHFGGYTHVHASTVLWPQLNVTRAPDSYTRNVSRSTLVSRMLTRHTSAWTQGNVNIIPPDWIRSMLCLNGFRVASDEKIENGPDDWP